MNGIIIFGESRELTEELETDQKAALLDALMSLASGEEVDLKSLDSSTRIAFKAMRQKVDAMNERYEETVTRRSEAGKAGAKVRWSKEENAEVCERISDDANNANACERISDDANNGLTKTKPKTNTNQERNKYSFSDAWEAYPRKQGRKAAEAYYKRAIKSGTKHEEIMAGIDRYKAYLAREKIGDQYVKMGSTFFSGACWNDDYGEAAVKTNETDYTVAMRDIFLQSMGGLHEQRERIPGEGRDDAERAFGDPEKG